MSELHPVVKATRLVKSEAEVEAGEVSHLFLATGDGRSLCCGRAITDVESVIDFRRVTCASTPRPPIEISAEAWAQGVEYGRALERAEAAGLTLTLDPFSPQALWGEHLKRSATVE